MKKTTTILTLGIIVLFMIHCSPKIGQEVTKGPIPSAEQIKADFTVAQLDQGKMIWQSSCIKCHKLHEPESRTPEQWNRVLKRMIPKAKLNLNDAQLVRAHLIMHARES